MKKLCDLHTHSIFSDGTYTPTEIIDSAINIGLSAVALCDHNTIDGLPEFLSAAIGKNIEAIPGTEFSVDYKGTELHLLGLFIPEKYFLQVSELMEDVNNRKEESNMALVASLNADGYSLDYETIKNKSPNGKINRAHIAAELTAKGYTHSIKQAFATLLSKTSGHYIEPKRLTVWEMLDFIRQIQAISVLAHPFLNLSKQSLIDFLPKAKGYGLRAMECFYSLYDEKTTNVSLQLANANDLRISGGSDFHGVNKPDILLGFGKGNLEIPYELVTKLQSKNRGIA